jgi:hypothetical protein
MRIITAISVVAYVTGTQVNLRGQGEESQKYLSDLAKEFIKFNGEPNTDKGID